MNGEDMYYALFDIKQSLQEVEAHLSEKDYVTNEEEEMLKYIRNAQHQLDSVSDLIEWLSDLGLLKGDAA